jgi:hypothetical protein
MKRAISLINRTTVLLHQQSVISKPRRSHWPTATPQHQYNTGSSAPVSASTRTRGIKTRTATTARTRYTTGQRHHTSQQRETPAHRQRTAATAKAVDKVQPIAAGPWFSESVFHAVIVRHKANIDYSKALWLNECQGF